MTETDLIEGLRKQSPKAQQETIDRYGREVFALVARLVSATSRAANVWAFIVTLLVIVLAVGSWFYRRKRQ